MRVGKFFRSMLPMDVRNPQETLFKHLKEEVAIEPKLDGVRCQLHKSGDSIILYTRKRQDITQKLPEVVGSVRTWPNDVILDGELLSLGKDGLLGFNEINKKIKSGEGNGIFLTFDILYLDDPIYYLPFWERRELLLSMPVVDHVRPVPQIVTKSSAELKQAYVSLIRKGFEGIIIKDLHVPYYFNRTWYMKRLKPVRTLDLKVTSVAKGNGNYFVYDVSSLEGLIGKITVKGNRLSIGEIVEVKYDKFIPSEAYPLGKSLRFAAFVRRRKDKTTPDAVGDKVAEWVHL